MYKKILISTVLLIICMGIVSASDNGTSDLDFSANIDESDFEETERAGNSFKMKGNSFSLIRVVTR